MRQMSLDGLVHAAKSVAASGYVAGVPYTSERHIVTDRTDRLDIGQTDKPRLALQLRFLKGSESMGNHDSNIVDACCVD
jgi:hypothetical protein